MKTIAVTSLLSIVAVGCATTYRPQKPGVISYVLDGPGFSLYKNGEEYGASGLSSAPIRAVAGNPLAEEHARIFVRRSRIAWTLLGIAVASLAAGLALNPNGRAQGGQRQAALVLDISALAIVLTGGGVYLTTPSHLYDAVNIYNDGQRGTGQ